MNSFQCEQKNIKIIASNFFNSTKKYVLCLLLSTGKKNCTSMALSLGVKYGSIREYFHDFKYQKEELKNFFIAIVNLYSTKENPGIIIADSTQIAKLYGKKLEKLGYDFNNSLKSTVKGISAVTIVWTNGEIAIPLNFDYWIREKDLKDKELYKKKTAITKELILEYKHKIPFDYIALDGEYGTEDFLLFLGNNYLKYIMRIQKNRKVMINGILLKLKDHSMFQLKRNTRYVRAKGSYKGIYTNFISHKRKGKNNSKQIVFIASNIDGLTPKEYVDAYSGRWPIEKMFRTLKQSLGLQQCQSISSENQRAHIFANFLAFTELEIQKINKKKKSPEQVLKSLRLQTIDKINPDFALGEGIIM
jgi:SRSO17 transposase